MRSLSNRVNHLQKETNPVLTTSPLRTNPVAKTATAQVWVPRSVRVFKSGTAGMALTGADLCNSLSGTGLTMKVLGIKLWNVTNQGASSNFVRLVTEAALTVDGSVTIADDLGCSSSLPGVKVNVPDLLSKQAAYTTSSTGVLCTAIGTLTGLVATAAQNYLFEVQVLVKAV
jgi:hypothetical protein